MDVEWALEQLRAYLRLTERVALPPEEQKHNRKTRTRGTKSEVYAAELVVEAVAVAVYGAKRYWINRDLTERLIWELTAGDHVRQRLGLEGPSPAIDAATLHPWVWDAAAPHWQSGNHRAAIWAAAINVNTRTQRKVGRPDLGEGKLLQEVFGLASPKPGRPRLRLVGEGNPELFRDVHVGASALGQGLYSAVRNPISHVPEEDHDLSEVEALEALAGFSLLARWIDRAEVASAEDFTEGAADAIQAVSPILTPR